MRFRVPRDPPIVDLADRNRIEVVDLRPAPPFGDDEVRLLEHPQVLHHSEPGHVGSQLTELCQRLAVAGAQRIEDHPAVPVGQRLEDRLERIVHTQFLGDHLVTCQVCG